MGVSGVPEVKNGTEIGFTDFSELAVGPGLPAALTAFGISAQSPTTVAIARDDDEGHYFAMSGHGGSAWGYGYDAFSGKMEGGEILVRVLCTFPDALIGRRNLGGAASMSGLVGLPDASPDFDCWAGSLVLQAGLDIETNGLMINDGVGSAPLNAVNLQEDFQNPVWCWIRTRKVPNGGTPANDDWTSTAWYGAYRDEPASPDGSSVNQGRTISGFSAIGWAMASLAEVTEQRIAYLAYSADPATEPPPPPVVYNDFPEPIVAPRTVSDLWSAGPLRDVGPSGLIQTRSTKAAGWSWQQRWGLLNIRNLGHMELITFLERAWDRGIIFTIKHALVPGSGLPPNGLGSSGVLIKDAGQLVGNTTILTQNWPTSIADIVRGGDVIKIGGDSTVYLVTATVSSDSSGEVTLPISPPLRKSPVADATVMTTDVTFRAVVTARSKFEGSRRPVYFDGYAVTLQEALS